MSTFRSGPLGLSLVGLLAATLAGCAAPTARTATKDYVPPQAGPTARLLMRGAMAPGNTYTVFHSVNAHECKQFETVGIGSAAANPPAKLIQAGGLETLTAVFLRTDKTSCVITWSFYPRAGRSYLLTAENLPGACRANLADATDPDHIVREPSAVRRNVNGQFCVPMTQLQAAGLGMPQSDQSTFGQQGAPASAAGGELRNGVTDDQLKDLIGGAR